MVNCPNCGEYYWNDNHKCAPCWYVWEEDDYVGSIIDSRSHKVFASNSQYACEKFADKHDYEFPDKCEVYVILEDDLIKILGFGKELTDEIEKEILDKAERFQLYSEYIREFSAVKI